MASILCHTQVSCCWAIVMNGDFSWGDGNNSPTLFKQLTKHSISHLGISGCHPMDRHPQARSCKLATFVIFSTQERGSWSHHHPLQLDLLVLNLKFYTELMVKGASFTLNTWDWEKALSEPGFTALKRLREPATILTIGQHLATGLRIRCEWI